MNIVLYTAIFGGYDSLKQPVVPQSCRLVCFTDAALGGVEKKGVWEISKVERKLEDATREARWYKTHPHVLFPEADVTIWVDGSAQPKVDLTVMIDKLLGAADISIYMHNQRNCIYAEGNAVIHFKRDDEDIVNAQMARYRNEGFPSGRGLVSSGVVFRRHSDRMTEFNEMWWSEIEKGSRRDQLSFNYCLWKKHEDIRFFGIPGNIYDGRIVVLHASHPKMKKEDFVEEVKRTPGVEVFLVKYFDAEEDQKMWRATTSYLESIGASVRIWDNTSNNIGLVAARKKMLEASNHEHVCFMDFDFRGLHLDLNEMSKKLRDDEVGMVVPWTPPSSIDNSMEWEDKSYIQCSVMMVSRNVLDSIGGLDEAFNTAYGDWDLVKRLGDSGRKVVQHNRSFAIHAPTPKTGHRVELWKKDYSSYISKNKQPMERTEQPMKVVLADSNGSHFKWLKALGIGLMKSGFDVCEVAGWGRDKNWWKSNIEGASIVFLWNGAHPVFHNTMNACKELSIPYFVVEVGWFPQSKFFFVDPSGINCRSSLIEDSLDWVGPRQYAKLDKIRKQHIGEMKWNANPDGHVLIPLQLEEDMNWVLDGNVGSMQDFIDHAEQRFGDKAIFKRHPLDKKEYRTSNPMIRSGSFLQRAQNASLVYGVNSTCLLEAALMGVPVKSVGGGYLRSHKSHPQKILAALADRQIPIERENVDYWFADIMAQRMEDTVGHSEVPWNALSNSAIVVIPCRNCEKYIGECLDSVTSQTWEDVGVIVIDDCSDDSTAKVARKHLKGIDHLVIKNSFRRWAMRNIDTAVSWYCDNEESVIFLLDGDDYLLDDAAIEKMMGHHKTKDVVWSTYKTDVKGWTHAGGMMDQRVSLRKQRWNMSPFRSFKKFLFDSINREEFLDSDGSYLKVTWDQAIMFPIAEMVPPTRWHFIQEVFYYYRMHGQNDHARGRAEQIRAEGVIRGRPAAHIHPRYYDEMNGVTVVVSCYNQMHVLPMFLESMFFQRRSPEAVIVADDGSTDGVCEWIEENANRYPFPLTCVTRKHEGYRLASLENMGAKHVTSGRILFTNADVLHCPESIESHWGLTGVGGGVVKGIAADTAKSVKKEDVQNFEYIIALQEKAPSWRENPKYIKSTDPNKNPIGVWGGNFSVPRVKFEEVGGFDEEFKGWGGEDNELTRRLTKAGCKVEWVMESKVYHLDHDHKRYAKEQTGSSYYLRKMSGKK